MNVTRQREGGTMVVTTITARPAEVDYDDIIAAVEIEPDNDCQPPWEECEAYEHTAVTAEVFGEQHPNAETSAMRGRAWHAGDRERVVIQVDPDAVEEWGNYAYYRASGASKQVARELTAMEVRRTVDQLVDWYENGWEYWYVGGTFELKGEDGNVIEEYPADGCGGIDDFEYAEEVQAEHADAIADQLAAAGYTVVNRPEPKPFDPKAHTKERIRRAVHLFDVGGR